MSTTVTKLRQWLHYVDRLIWERGNLDESSYHAALRAASLGIEQDYVFDALCCLIENAGDAAKPDKIRSQISRAYAYVGASRSDAAKAGVVYYSSSRAPAIPRPKVKPVFDPKALQQVAAKVAVNDIFDLVIRKSVRTPEYVRSCDYLDALFQPREKIPIFTMCKSSGQLLYEREVTLPEEVPVSGPDGVWFLINPVDGRFHPNPRQGGRLSRRSEESVTTFRFALLESDEAPADEWLKLLVQLPLPIESICESGGRSIHALLRVNAKSKGEWDSIIKPSKPLFTRLGADPGALRAVQLSRLPQAFRGDRQQRLLYLNPSASPTPILEVPDRPMWQDWVDWIELVHRGNMEARPHELVACIENLERAPSSMRISVLIQLIKLRGGVL